MDAAMHATASQAAVSDAPAPLQLEPAAPQPAAEPAAPATQLSSGQRQPPAQPQDDVRQLADAVAALGRANGIANAGDLPPPVEVLVPSPTKQAAYQVQVRTLSSGACPDAAAAGGQASAFGSTPPLANGHAQHPPNVQDGMKSGPFADLAARLLALHMDETRATNGSAQEHAKGSRTRVLRFDPSVGKSGQFYIVEGDAFPHTTAASSNMQLTSDMSARSDLQSNSATELDSAGSRAYGSDGSSQQDARVHGQQGTPAVDGLMHDRSQPEPQPGAPSLPDGNRPPGNGAAANQQTHSQPVQAAHSAVIAPSATSAQEPSQPPTLSPEASWADQSPAASSMRDGTVSIPAPGHADRLVSVPSCHAGVSGSDLSPAVVVLAMTVNQQAPVVTSTCACCADLPIAKQGTGQLARL